MEFDIGRSTISIIVLICFILCAFLLSVWNKPTEETEDPDKYKSYRGIDLTQCPPDLSHAKRCKWLLGQEPKEGFSKVRDSNEANRVWLIYDLHYKSSE